MSRNFGICQYLVETWQRLMGHGSREQQAERDKCNSQWEELKSLDLEAESAPLPQMAPPAPEPSLVPSLPVSVQAIPVRRPQPRSTPQAPPEPAEESDDFLGVDVYMTGQGRVLRAWLTDSGVWLYGSPDWVARCEEIEERDPDDGGMRTLRPGDGAQYLFALLDRYDAGRRRAYYPNGVYAVEIEERRRAY